KSVEFLGHVITPDGIKPNLKKINTLNNFKIPNTQKETKSFLGWVVTYDKIFLNSFNQTFICKSILMNDPIISNPDFTKPFILTTDAAEL
ncbi:hypothetical protein YQE_08959, partial [Dendroctonus ponderosae]